MVDWNQRAFYILPVKNIFMKKKHLINYYNLKDRYLNILLTCFNSIFVLNSDLNNVSWIKLY